LARDLLLIILY